MVNLETKIRQIQAMLDKTVENGCTEEEAMASLMMAQEMMAKYNLEMADLAKTQPTKTLHEDITSEVVKGGNKSAWRIQLARTIADNFRCNILISTGYGILFLGTKMDLAICISVYNFALAIIDRETKKIRRDARKAGTNSHYIANDYILGFLAGVKAKFQDQVEKNNWGLILVKSDALVTRTKELTTGTAKPRKGITHTGNQDLYQKGYKRGKNLEVQKTISA